MQVGHLSDVLFEDMHAESENGILIGGTTQSPVRNISFKVAVPLSLPPAYVVLMSHAGMMHKTNRKNGCIGIPNLYSVQQHLFRFCLPCNFCLCYSNCLLHTRQHCSAAYNAGSC